MKILRVISSMDPSYGGPCQGIRNIIPELEKLGVGNEVVCLNNPEASYLSNDPFPVHALGDSSGPWGYHKGLRVWLRENMERFDAVIIHGLWQYYGYVTYKVWKGLVESKRPYLLVMPHGMLDPYFQKAEGRKLKAIRNWLYWKLFEGNILNKSDAVLFTSEVEMQLARRTFRPYFPAKEFNAGYGIALPPSFEHHFQDAFYTLCPECVDKNYLLFLSRIHEKKGVDLLIKAYLKLLAQGRDLPDLVIAGPGLETEFGKNIKKLAEKGVNIHFVGMLHGKAKWGALYGCQAFVLPSHQENFGIAVVEALACGKPVLISDQVNIWREILDSEAGLIGKDTEAGVYSLLTEWLDCSIEKKEKMRANAIQIYNERFAIEAVAQTLKGLLSGLNRSY